MQELNSIRVGEYWDDVKRRWLDPVLIRKAREEEMQYVKKHAVYEKGPHEAVLEGDGEEPHQDRLGRHEQGNVRVSSEHIISLGREGIQHWTQSRLVQRNITSGGSEARLLGGSVKGEAQSFHRASRRRRRRTRQSAVRAAEKELVGHP